MKHGPQCPNHHVALVDLPFPMTAKGIATCPISGCSFEYEMELDETKNVVNSAGEIEPQKNFNVTGNET